MQPSSIPLDELRDLVLEIRALSKGLTENYELEERISHLEKLIEGDGGLKEIITALKTTVEALLKTREKGCLDCAIAQQVNKYDMKGTEDRIKILENLMKDHAIYWKIVAYLISPAYVLSVIGMLWAISKIIGK